MLANIPPPPGNALELGPLTIRYYGIAIAIGVLVAITVARRRYAALGGDPEVADRVGLWAVAFGVVGARLGYVTTNFPRFLEEPLAIVAIWRGGLVFFGGLTLGTIAALYFLRRYGAHLPTFTDAAAPAIPLAHAIGRWGNYFNQELYGTPTDLPWALEIERGGMVVQTVHPTFLYESLWNFTLAGFLVWLGRGGRVARGALIFVYAIGYGVARFLLELIRTDTEFRLLGLSRNAYAAMLIVAIGTVGLVWTQRRAARPTGETVPAPPGAGAGGEPDDGDHGGEPDRDRDGDGPAEPS